MQIKQHAKFWRRLARAPRSKRRGKMNKLEAAYAELLAVRQIKGEVLWWIFEGQRFRLGDEANYTPDFAVQLADGTIELHEVKGFWREAARLRIKLAAGMFPYRFLAVRRVKGEWRYEDFSHFDPSDSTEVPESKP